MVLYFSGTGNSRYCAELTARLLGDEAVDLRPFLRESKPVWHSERPWVIVAPVYAWRLPRIVAALLRRSRWSGSRDIYFILTCGSDIGAAGRWNAALCRQMGLDYRGTLKVVMPENYLVLYDVPEEAEARQIIADAGNTLAQGAELIRNGAGFPPQKTDWKDWWHSVAGNPAHYRRLIKDKLFYATEECIGCGKCARLCPLHNIRMEQNRPVWNGNCTHCMACISGCPTASLEYSNSTRGKKRYFCPEVPHSPVPGNTAGTGRPPVHKGGQSS